MLLRLGQIAELMKTVASGEEMKSILPMTRWESRYHHLSQHTETVGVVECFPLVMSTAVSKLEPYDYLPGQAH